MPKKLYHSVKFDAFFYTFNFFTKDPLFLLLAEANLFLAIFKYSILLSMPTNFRFCFLHTTPVVPLPQNGSKTRSPVLLGRGKWTFLQFYSFNQSLKKEGDILH